MAKTVRKDVIEFLGVWEKLHNPDFKCLEFEAFKNRTEANDNAQQFGIKQFNRNRKEIRKRGTHNVIYLLSKMFNVPEGQKVAG